MILNLMNDALHYYRKLLTETEYCFDRKSHDYYKFFLLRFPIASF